MLMVRGRKVCLADPDRTAVPCNDFNSVHQWLNSQRQWRPIELIRRERFESSSAALAGALRLLTRTDSTKFMRHLGFPDHMRFACCSHSSKTLVSSHILVLFQQDGDWSLDSHSSVDALKLESMIQVIELKKSRSGVTTHRNFEPPTPSGKDVRAYRLATEIARSGSLLSQHYLPYFGVVASLPPPTPKQVRAFVERGLCNAHSWYKKLPAPPGHPFWVYVSPIAGMVRLEPNGAWRNRECGGPHYNHITTLEYRQRYGPLAWSSVALTSCPSPNGLMLELPPSVASGYDSCVWLSFLCHEDGYLTSLPSSSSSALHTRRSESFEELIRVCRQACSLMEPTWIFRNDFVDSDPDRIASSVIEDLEQSLLTALQQSHHASLEEWRRAINHSRQHMLIFARFFVGRMMLTEGSALPARRKRLIESLLQSICTTIQRWREHAAVEEAIGRQLDVIYGRQWRTQ
eukprot:gnl/MRDRNA2_/MRDRNA2_63453_c0_seq2.p1 gnl/MRDRNA2_/MRDRNA2_63453_c0~~gnl/MRDRNA2_/MRDRNA2_63453_c0_seq2.p1  ORF type:complete len:460 (+),score=54.75 gnl/MRDRNA2_/MRDRNA2_63453_c0_seq2:87-1466(+)